MNFIREEKKREYIHLEKENENSSPTTTNKRRIFENRFLMSIINSTRIVNFHKQTNKQANKK